MQILKHTPTLNTVIMVENTLKNFKYGNLYGKKFLIPNNSETYLKERFGNDWKVPDSKYFFEWRE